MTHSSFYGEGMVGYVMPAGAVHRHRLGSRFPASPNENAYGRHTAARRRGPEDNPPGRRFSFAEKAGFP